ncbi:DUF3891 family protein [Egbenema bharatensis]|uniref:DUF3891 family protein n=1 Tax=Egbenema bharatensis TaxID=3463334 RepID=UPI003A842FB6
MMYRHTPQGLVCITQPAHAWVSGQLARSWGNDRFGTFAPWEAVCLGAEQHDIGWLQWEAMPTFNPETGHPHSFIEMETESHIALWSSASRLAMPYGRYVSLLVSLHGTSLYEHHTRWQQSPKLRPIVQRFLQQERDFQTELIATLQKDTYYQNYANPETIALNQKLVAIWDSFSLLLCMGLNQPKTIEQVPTFTSETDLTLTPIHTDIHTGATQITVDPWCFQTEQVQLAIEGRLLQEMAKDEQSMRHQLKTAPWTTISIKLEPKPSR